MLTFESLLRASKGGSEHHYRAGGPLTRPIPRLPRRRRLLASTAPVETRITDDGVVEIVMTGKLK